jgi:predicted nuclease of predicted toxin-antitoxin system
MRFLIDECTGPAVAHWLADQGHDVASVYDDDPGIDDADVVAWAADEQRILVTNDKDFGDRVFRDKEIHAGVILLRLDE